ncbi:PREDICTED: uncharacterized protein LOC104806182 [Tarenaya hassleriana]|uniref:uncharacterized protein LOC104806182 n=1 Tax=Tarenaya hassleriana TaxID=28532 RepID=UPI00053C6A7C|nr:PREDICTED: uncharacterized protein LOC104806182 [Tarenaya hassleriana]
MADREMQKEFKKMKDLFEEWGIRGIIIFSLTLQTILIFLAPSRKRMARKLFLVLIWSAYLLADWAADYAVGQISDTQGDAVQENDIKKKKTTDLLAFWAPFLLLHLGGPDTITALALEDNELWLRHLFGLICQAIATVYVILLSTPNTLLLPTILMLVSGLIKYFERTISLYSASLEKFKDLMLQEPNPGPNYAKLMEEYEAKKDMRIPTKVEMGEADKDQKADVPVRPNKELTHLEVVQYAYKYFNIFKGLVVDLFFSFQQRDESKKFFDSLTPEEALRILEVELSFIYDALFTKAKILHTGAGELFRFVSLGSLVSSLVIFMVKKKDAYEGFDIGLTYALLVGGIALDSIAILMFCLSDWTFARLSKLKEELDQKDTLIDEFLNRLLSFRRLNWRPYPCFNKNKENVEQVEHHVLDRKFIFRRWSEYVYGYNLIGYCLKKTPEEIHHTKGYIHTFFQSVIESLFIDRAFEYTIIGIKFCFTAMKQINDKLHSRIDHLISYLSQQHRVIRKVLRPVKPLVNFWFTIPSRFGHLIYYIIDFFGVQDQVEEIRFTSRDRLTKELWVFIFEQVKYKSHFADDPETAKRIFSARNDWEIGKMISSAKGDWILREIQNQRAENDDWKQLELRYVTEVDYDQSILLWHIATEIFYQEQEKEHTKENHSHREFSKILSDYMMYLLIMQPSLTSTVAGIAKIRFRDTCEEAKRLFRRRGIKNSVANAASVITSVATEVNPMDVKGDRSKSVLFDASMLAKELQHLHSKREENMWEVIGKVWVELLCYAAAHCDSKEHAAQLSKGGELISFVWLLMAQFGIGEQFQITREDTRAKLIVKK